MHDPSSPSGAFSCFPVTVKVTPLFLHPAPSHVEGNEWVRPTMSSVLFNQSWLKFDGYHMRLEEDKQGTLFCLFFWLQARQNDTSEAKTHANFRILKWVICITRLNMCASWVTSTNKFLQLYNPIGLTCVLKLKMFNNLLSLSLSLTHEHTHAHTCTHFPLQDYWRLVRAREWVRPLTLWDCVVRPVCVTACQK
jgi:hypothetical protein